MKPASGRAGAPIPAELAAELDRLGVTLCVSETRAKAATSHRR